MKSFAKVLSVIMGIFMIIAGLYCLFTPGAAYLNIGYVVGLSMVFDAVGRFVNWHQAKKDGAADGWMLVGAILSAVFGFFVLNSTILQLGIDAFIVYRWLHRSLPEFSKSHAAACFPPLVLPASDCPCAAPFLRQTSHG